MSIIPKPIIDAVCTKSRNLFCVCHRNGRRGRTSIVLFIMEYHRVGEVLPSEFTTIYCPRDPLPSAFWVFHAPASAAFGCITNPTSANSYAPTDCAMCEDDYAAAALLYTCSKCSGAEGVVVAILALALASVVLAAVVVHLLSAPKNIELIGARPTMIRTKLREVMQAIPSQALKTIVVSWQILTQVSWKSWAFAVVVFVSYFLT